MYAALMLKAGDVDGMVSGACHSTANTLRPGLQVIKTAPGEKMVSAYFLMIAPPCGRLRHDDRAVDDVSEMLARHRVLHLKLELAVPGFVNLTADRIRKPSDAVRREICSCRAE